MGFPCRDPQGSDSEKAAVNPGGKRCRLFPSLTPHSILMKKADSAWSPFVLSAHGAETPFIARIQGGEPITVLVNQFGQVLDATTRQVLPELPDEMAAPTAAKAE